MRQDEYMQRQCRRAERKRAARRKGRRGIIKNILCWIGIILGCLLLIAVVVVLIFRRVGRKELYQASESRAPVLEVVSVNELVPESMVQQYGNDVIFYHGEPYRYNKDILTFLVMGIDRQGELEEEDEDTDYIMGGQADSLFLAVVNPHTEEIQMIGINRNAMAEVDVYDSSNRYVRTDLLQICLQHGYGSGLEDSCERQVKAVSTLFFQLPIHGYIAINMDAIPILNDKVGGVTLEVLENIPRGSASLAQGQGNVITLRGMDAFWYLKWRDTSVFDSAGMRLARQKQYLNIFGHLAMERTKEDVLFPLTLLNDLSGYMVTDINTSKITYLATTCIGYNFNINNIHILEGETIVGTGRFEEFYVDDEALYDLVIGIFYEKIN